MDGREDRDDTGDGGIGGADLTEETVLPVVEERAVVRKRRETRPVRLTRRARTIEQTVETEVGSEEVEVRHVKVERWVDAPEEVRHEGDTMIIPLMEEVVVTEKRLRVFEEIHVTKRHSTHIVRERVPVRREEIAIERGDQPARPDPDGDSA